jgi:hypothetical protein
MVGAMTNKEGRLIQLLEGAVDKIESNTHSQEKEELQKLIQILKKQTKTRKRVRMISDIASVALRIFAPEIFEDIFGEVDLDRWGDFFD